jgi:hypothetical protein
MKLKLAVAAVGLALSGAALADSAYIGQYGADNFAYVDQTNSGAYVNVYQNGDRNHVGQMYTSEGINYYYAGVIQTNVASGYVNVSQFGNDNWANVYQYQGSGMNAQIQQGGGYYDQQAQTFTDYGPANSNSAYVSQYYSDNVNGEIRQFGNNNYAYTNQYLASNSSATILQFGNGHSAGIGQQGNNNTGRIVQR